MSRVRHAVSWGLLFALLLAVPPEGHAGEEAGGLLLLGPDGRALDAVRVGRSQERFEDGFVFARDLDFRSVPLARGLLSPVPEAAGPDEAVVLWGEGLAATVLARPPAGVVGRRLAPAAPLEGYVRFDRGRPAVGVEVLARPANRAPTLVHRTRTDPVGRYRFGHLAPGPWEVLVRRGDGRLQSLGTFAAGAAGVEAVIEPGSIVEGQVLDGDASRRTGIPGFALRLVRLPRAADDVDAAPEVVAGEKGLFLLEDVGAGIYEARPATRGWFFDPEVPRVEVPARGRVKLRGFFAVRARAVTGRIEGPDGKGVPGARVELLVDPTREAPPGGWPSVEAAVTEADGTYRLKGLRAARGYRLAVSAPGLAGKVTLPFAVSGPADTIVPTVLLARGWQLEIRARRPGGAPVAGVAFRAMPARFPVDAHGGAGTALVRTAKTDADGLAVLADLPAEDVRAFVVEDAGWAPVRRLVPYPRSGDVRTWAATLFPAPTVKGEVEIAGDDPLPELVVQAIPRDGSKTHESDVDPDGAFVLEGLPAVPVDLVVRPKGGSGPALTRLEGIVPGTADHVRIVIPALVRVEGRVHDIEPDGRPAMVLLEAPILDPDRDEYRWRTVARAALERGATRAPFAFGLLAPGTYALRAVQGGNDSGIRTLTLEEGTTDGIDLVLPAPGRVAGTVLDPRDRPVLGAEVRLVRLRGDGDAPGRGSDAAARATDTDGDFVFEGVAPGLWRVEVRDAQRTPAVVTVRVEEGENLVLDDILLGRGGTLEGRVTDGEDRELDGARLLLDPLEDGVGERVVQTGRDGLFRAEDLRPGAWRLTLASRAGPFTDLEAWVEIVEGETTRVSLTATGRSSIMGRVRRRGQPVADAVVHLISLATLQEEGDVPRRLVTRTDGDGAFVWDGLPPGHYEVDLVDGGVRLTRRVGLDEGDRLELDLEAWEGRITGEVVRTSGLPVAGATVTARPAGAGVDGVVGRVRTGPEGTFLIAGLPEGPYDLAVEAPGLPPGRYDGAEAEVFGAERFVSVTLGRGGTLDLALRGDGGRGVRGARVVLESPRGFVLDGRPYAVAPSGRLQLEGVPAGPWRVRVHAPGYGRPGADVVHIREGEVSRLEVLLRPAARLVLEVTARHLDPVTRARIDLLRLPDREPVEWARRLGRLRLVPPAGYLLRAGALVFDDLGPGDYVLRIDAGQAFEAVEMTLAVPAGEDLERRVELVRTERPR